MSAPVCDDHHEVDAARRPIEQLLAAVPVELGIPQRAHDGAGIPPQHDRVGLPGWFVCYASNVPRRTALHQCRSGPPRIPSAERYAVAPMSDDIPFDKRFDLPPGRIDEVRPGVRRLLADNPGPFTFKGTLTYIVGTGEVAVIDPGPLDEAHIAALLEALRHETVTHILVTHTHRAHSPAAARIKAATGAKTYAEGPHRAARPLNVGEAKPLDSSGDRDFIPDVVLADGETVAGRGWTLEAVTTPGHTANHMAFALKGTELLFSGDHVMAWSTRSWHRPMAP